MIQYHIFAILNVKYYHQSQPLIHQIKLKIKQIIMLLLITDKQPIDQEGIWSIVADIKLKMN